MNKIQEIQLDLIKLASFNSFNGDRVASDLLANTDCWRGVIMTRLDSLIQLRDVAEGYWNVDTMFIVPVAGKENKLERLALTWEADEVSFLTKEETATLLGCYPASVKLLRIWWD